MFKTFNQLIKTQFQIQTKVLRSRNGKEYFNSDLDNYLAEQGVFHQSLCIYTPQQNVIDRNNKHLHEVARYLMLTTQPISSTECPPKF